eukprot:767083-Hanusia_phi.AAC.9
MGLDQHCKRYRTQTPEQNNRETAISEELRMHLIIGHHVNTAGSAEARQKGLKTPPERLLTAIPFHPRNTR